MDSKREPTIRRVQCNVADYVQGKTPSPRTARDVSHGEQQGTGYVDAASGLVEMRYGSTLPNPANHVNEPPLESCHRSGRLIYRLIFFRFLLAKHRSALVGDRHESGCLQSSCHLADEVWGG